MYTCYGHFLANYSYQHVNGYSKPKDSTLMEVPVSNFKNEPTVSAVTILKLELFTLKHDKFKQAMLLLGGAILPAHGHSL